MYKKILICLDNSDESTAGIDMGLDIALSTGAAVTGLHVYAARLHNMRFRQMEDGLPEEYRREGELKRQRDIHDDLITRGLRIVSDSYMTVLSAKAAVVGLTPSGVQREGKNYYEIVKEVEEGGYGLCVMGALGLGRTEFSRIGSVCERVVRRIKADTLVVRDTVTHGRGNVVVAIDGSPASFGALKRGMLLARVLDRPLEAVGVFDPDFHHSAFRSIAGVLTEEAGKLFRFKEQQRLHTDIIDEGLKKLYRDHLTTAEEIAAELGVKMRTVLLSGKPFDRISEYVKKTGAGLLVLGKTGVHGEGRLDIGGVTENCLRDAGCNVLITSDEFLPQRPKIDKDNGVIWTEGAEEKLSLIPSFARGVAKAVIEDAALKAGVREITADFMLTVRKDMDL